MCFDELGEFNSVHMSFTEVNRLETNFRATCKSLQHEGLQKRAKVEAKIMVRECSVPQPLHILSFLYSAVHWLKFLSCIHSKAGEAFNI